MSCCDSGSGGSSSTQQFTPPAWTTDYGSLNASNPQGPWQAYLAQASSLAQQPYQAYPGQTIAALNPTQYAGMDMAAQTAMNGSPDTNAARGQFTDSANGLYLNNNPWTSAGSAIGQMASGANLNANPWLQNGYTDAVIADNAAQMAQAARNGTMSQTDAAFARGGAFGGSAYNEMQARNAAALAGQVGTMANQYQLQRTGMGVQDYQSAVGNQLAANQMGNQSYTNERANQMAASQAGLGGQALDLQAAQTLTGVGDAQRQYTQDLLNQGQNAWNQQLLWPQQQLDNYGNALARASGNVAGGSTGTTTQNYQASPLAALFGLGAAGYGAYQLAK